MRDAALVAVEAEEVAALRFALVVLDLGRAAAGRVAALGALDLDHVGALVGQHHRAVRAGDLEFEGQYGDAIERFAWAIHPAPKLGNADREKVGQTLYIAGLRSQVAAAKDFRCHLPQAVVCAKLLGPSLRESHMREE